MALLTTALVAARYIFNTGSIATQEAVVYMHACFFMLGAAYTLKHNGHVRVDIFYNNMSERSRAWVNATGCIVFLVPLFIFIAISSWNFVEQSWQIRETSSDTGGIPAVFLLKSFIPLMCLTLVLQAVAEVLRSLLILMEGKPSS